LKGQKIFCVGLDMEARPTPSRRHGWILDVEALPTPRLPSIAGQHAWMDTGYWILDVKAPPTPRMALLDMAIKIFASF
jgi:hypothetical protein